MLKELLEKLIRFKTTPDNKRELRRALAWIKSQVKMLPVEIQEHTVNGSPSLIITTQDTKTPVLWLQAHLDVVNGSAEIFRPRVKGKRMYGRGSYDMKFAIACYIKLLKDLKKNLSSLDFGIMITSDEEVGGKNGVRAMVEKGYRSQVAFLPDGGSEWSIEQGAKGVLRLNFKSSGVSAHGSRPWEGRNAIEDLMSFLYTVKQEIPDSPEGSVDHYHNTMNVGVVKGGDAVNMVPNYAEAEAEFRFTHTSSRKEIEEIIYRVKKGFKNISIDEILFMESTSIDPENDYCRVYGNILKKTYKKNLSFMVSHGASDARYFTSVGIPTLLLRPKGDGLHSESEWVDLKSLDQFYEIMKLFVIEVAKYKGLSRFRIIKIFKNFIRSFWRKLPL